MRLTILTATAALALTAAAPALAQSLSEVTIVGRYAGPGQEPRSLSRPVNFADLDLSREKDMKMLKQRISLTARDLCSELGEPQTEAVVGRSCRADAEASAWSQLKQVASVESYAVPASATASVVTNGPVPDTAANRAAYGGPQSHAGKATAPKGN